MIRSSWIKGIGLLVVLMMAVRVSITPGVRHQHQHGDHPHSHHHGHIHGPHSHTHEPAETVSGNTHVHIFLFGWEFTFSTPFGTEETITPQEAAAESTEYAPQVESSPLDPAVTMATTWGTLIQWVFDIRSPAPPGKMELPQGMLSQDLSGDETGFASRDRDKPLSPPPERGMTFPTVG